MKSSGIDDPAYEISSRMTSVIYPEGEVLGYKYNPVGRLTELADSKYGTIRMEYDPEGKRTRQVWPNGLSTKWEYDPADRLTGILPEQAKKVPAIGYTYDLRDNRLTMDRSDSGINRYQYDAISQLTKAELPWGDTQEYTYDPVGNRLEMKDKRGVQWYKYDDGDELLEIESTFNPEGNDMNLALQAKVGLSDEAQARYKTVFTYDAAGNQVTKTGPGKKSSQYAFDSLNRMVGMDAPGSSPQVNTFDSQDRRIGISSGESEGKTFLRGACGSAILNEVSANGKVTDRYLVMPNGRVVGHVENTGNKVSFYHFDALGNTVAVSDGSGNILSTQVYEPFGASRSTPPSKDMFGFVGEHGVETADGELMRMGAREYSSGTGRFISRDPLIMLRSNIYGYASNNPIMAIDPRGLYDSSRSQQIGEACKGQDSGCLARLSQESQGIFLDRDPDKIHWKEGIANGLSSVPNSGADFMANYNAMKSANTIGADKYFHCMANCQASSRGLIGTAIALGLSIGREAIDMCRLKGLNDSIEDLDADYQGMIGGSVGLDCKSACESLRPVSLPARF